MRYSTVKAFNSWIDAFHHFFGRCQPPKPDGTNRYYNSYGWCGDAKHKSGRIYTILAETDNENELGFYNPARQAANFYPFKWLYYFKAEFANVGYPLWLYASTVSSTTIATGNTFSKSWRGFQQWFDDQGHIEVPPEFVVPGRARGIWEPLA